MEKPTIMIAGIVLILGITVVASVSSGEKRRTDLVRKSIQDKHAREEKERAQEERERKLAAIRAAQEAERKRKQEQTMALISLGMKAAMSV